jgi:hypothetical protein
MQHQHQDLVFSSQTTAGATRTESESAKALWVAAMNQNIFAYNSGDDCSIKAYI